MPDTVCSTKEERMMTIYQEEGYANRRDYLESLAEDYGVPVKTVFSLASILGPEEDFDALVTEVEDYSYSIQGGDLCES